MKLDLRFPELEAQRARMGAEQSNWRIGSVQLNPRQELLWKLNTGIEIDLKDVEVGPGGLLSLKGEQVVLYIKDTQSSLWTLQNDPEQSKRYHVAECETLRDMRSKGRFERYVVTNRTDGTFLVDWLDRETRERGETEAALKVCRNCLKALNYRGYKSARDGHSGPNGQAETKSEIWSEFSISNFMMDYSTFFHSRPARRDVEAPLNDYVADWSRISERRRRAVDWVCEECHVDLSDYPNLLHCHHRNGVASDNSNNNLVVLCADCHSAQPHHGHMKVSAADRSRIAEARMVQRQSLRGPS